MKGNFQHADKFHATQTIEEFWLFMHQPTLPQLLTAPEANISIDLKLIKITKF